MATKAKPKKSAKKASKSKVTKLKGAAGIGHNGKVNKPLCALFDKYAAMDADKKAIGKAQRDIRAKAKEEHGVSKDVFAYEVNMRKKAPDARVMFEQGCLDLKDALGYQHVLPGLLEDGEDSGEGGSEDNADHEEEAA